MSLKKIGIIFLIVLVTFASIYGYIIYKDIFSVNTNLEKAETFIYVPTGASYTDVENIIAPFIQNMDRFRMVANKKKYVNRVKSGKFLLKKGMNSNDIVTSLLKNIPVKLTFNNQETIEKLVGRISSQIEADSISLLNSLKDPSFLTENGFTEDNILSMFIPNTYEFFWNTSANQFKEKMSKEYRKFWNEERKQKAAQLNLTPLQVIVLASIVHKETVKVDERSRVAGVYLNRLRIGMRLEADPTVIYAIKKQTGNFDIVIKRVLFKDLKVDSPYNTYLYSGLPPGPIAMPDITAIDAVLNSEQHNYIYFCASVTNFGYHQFASTLAEHNANRQKYITWINKQEINR